MKKLLPSLVFLLVLGAGGATVYLFQKQHRGTGSIESTGEFLPAETQLLLSVPDVEGTLAEWKTTDLYKIWTEPEVQDFLAKPLSKLPPHQDFEDAVERIVRLSPTNVFLALTSLDEKTHEPHIVAGFDFKGDKAEVEQLLAGPKDALRKQWPEGKADLTEYQGHALESFEDGSGSLVVSTYLDHRYLVANDVALLKATLDRCDHRAPAPGEANTLDKDADFRTVLARLPARPATLAFIRPQAGLNRLFDLLTAAGQPVTGARSAELDKIKAIGATTTIENGKLRDTLFCLAPGMDLDLAKLRLSSLALTSPATLFYGAATFDVPSQWNLPAGPPPPGTPVSGLVVGLQEFAAKLQAHGLTLERFQAAFGKEFSLHLDWPGDRPGPTVLATAEVRDHAAAAKFLDDLTSVNVDEGVWQTSKYDGLTYCWLSTNHLVYVTPSLTVTDKHLVLGMSLDEVREAVQREQAGKPNLTGSEAYKGALSLVTAPNSAFVYLDSAALFERVYGTVRGFAMLGAALLYPQLTEYVDLGKLPEGRTVSKHLSPIVFFAASDEQGSLLESVGSFTLGQAAFVVVGGASAAAIPVMQSQLGAAAGSSGPAPQPTPAAAAAPSASPVSPVSPTPQDH